jgi:hypothetical protein
MLGQYEVIRACAAAGAERFAVYDLENHQGTSVYVPAKVVVVDDVWAMIGSDNLNRRSWSHDSELSIGVLTRSRTPESRATLPVTETGPGRSLTTSASGYGASISTAGRTTWTISCIRKGPLPRPRTRPGSSLHGTKPAALDLDPGGAAAPVRHSHRRAAAMGNSAVPDGLRPGRAPLAGPLARPALTREGSGLRGALPGGLRAAAAA